MAVELFTKVDLGDFARLKGHVRVAAAIGLTMTAKDAQTALKDEVGSVLHLRNSWVKKGVQIDPATPGNLKARVGSIDKYMDRHVSGDRKDAGKSLSIGGHQGSSGRIATGGLLIGMYAGIANANVHNKEHRILNRIDGQKKKTFQLVGRGGKVVLIARRTSKSRKGLEFLAVLKNNVSEKAVWPMAATVDAVVAAHFTSHFKTAISSRKK